MNNVGFVISKEDLALGPGTRLDGSLKSFCAAEFIKVTKGTERASDTDIRRGQKEYPLASVSNGVIYLLISYYNESKECLKFREKFTRPTPTIYILG